MIALDRRQYGGSLPKWVPAEAQRYLAHTECGASLRSLARASGCHPSTVLRQVRKLEGLRDDPLVDAALRRLGGREEGVRTRHRHEKESPVSDMQMRSSLPVDEETLAREAARILRRLCESGALLAVAQDMERALVVRETGPGSSTRIAVVDTAVAQALALKGWIACEAPGRVSRYRITAAGRAALAGFDAGPEATQVPGLAEAPTRFLAASGAARDEEALAGPSRRRGRITYGETPLVALARRRDKRGRPFLTDAQVAAGERLREDFELEQLDDGQRIDWRAHLRQAEPADYQRDAPPSGPGAARARFARALDELGPGLGDMALLCCCHLEGLETAERRLGWSARSGKIVLRIALQRLARHYEALGPGARGLIG